MKNLERYLNCLEYGTVDRCPNHEVGYWPQTAERWLAEGLDQSLHPNWLEREDLIGLDPREYIPVNYGMIPPFEHKVIERDDRYEIFQDSLGITHKALLEGSVGGARMCMDTYLRFPVETLEDFRKLKKRYVAAIDSRYPDNLESDLLPRWKQRDYPLILGHNCAATGFYWRCREWMGTENLSMAFYDQPILVHEMMEFFADFTIEVSKPILEKINVECFNLNEDFAMKNGPLLGPETFKEFIFKPMKRLIEFFKSHGTRYIALDSDGNPTALIPLLMDAGVDILWPLERASDMHPVETRRKFGKSLRLSGGVDKRVLTHGQQAVDEHLRELQPLVEEGGYIPTIDHTVPPDISWDQFCYYMDSKHKLLECRL